MNAATDILALLGKAAAGLRADNLPREILVRSRQRVFDTLACLVGGYSGGISDAIRAYVHAQGGRPEATLFPGGEKTSVALASFAHAAYIHGLELSDAASRATAHPGNEIVPPVLALAEREGYSGAALLAAVVAGYEIELRVGRALFPSAFYRGWWTPGLYGGIGAGCASANIAGLDANAMNNTIGIVLNLLPTCMARANDEGGSIKWLIGGQSCAAGVLAADMAARGVTGMHDIAGGWLPVISNESFPERLTEGITPDGKFEKWEILDAVVTKHYATVGPLTTALDATFDLITKHDIKAEDIKEIHANCMKRTAIFNQAHPENEIAARASLPYCLAVAVCTKDPASLLGPAFRPEMLTDRRVWAAAEKVRITENEQYEAEYPKHSRARVTITLNDGKSVTQEDDRSARRRYLNPTDGDIEAKFRLVTTSVLGKAKTDKAVELILKLETLTNVRELVEALRP